MCVFFSIDGALCVGFPDGGCEDYAEGQRPEHVPQAQASLSFETFRLGVDSDVLRGHIVGMFDFFVWHQFELFWEFPGFF